MIFCLLVEGSSFLFESCVCLCVCRETQAKAVRFKDRTHSSQDTGTSVIIESLLNTLRKHSREILHRSQKFLWI